MYCRYENRGYCELNKKECVPASNGCVIRTAAGVTLTDDKKQPPSEALIQSLCNGYQQFG